jgi:hypothetical protein
MLDVVRREAGVMNRLTAIVLVVVLVIVILTSVMQPY